MSGIIAQNSGRHTGLVKASSAGGVWNLIKTYTASSDSDLSFVDGTDGVDFTAYDEFVFKFIAIHPADANKNLTFQCSTDGGSSYGVTLTSTTFVVYHAEDDSENLGPNYEAGSDQAQTTNFQRLTQETGNDADSCAVGTLNLFNPSSTTFVKHFTNVMNSCFQNSYTTQLFQAGYFNTTSAIDAIQFKFNSGNIDAGQISLYGIS